MTREELINLLALVKGDVEKLVKIAVYDIVRLSERKRSLGKDFTFDKDASLDRQVDKLLVLLGDDILHDVEEKALSTLGDERDKDEVLAYVNREFGGLTPIQRVDAHDSHLKFLIEGWLAIGFAGGLSSGAILTDIFIYMRNPSLAREWRDAVREGGFGAPILAEGGLSWGKGVAKSPIEGITLVGQTMVSDAWQKGTLLGYGRAGASGYVIHRGSAFDCPLCDSFCEKVYPLDYLVLPIHPRCCCWTEPVFGPPSEFV